VKPDGLAVFDSKLIKLLALYLIRGQQQSDQIDLLSRAGFKPAEIADLLGTTPNTVNVTLSAQRAARKKKRVKKSK
jgi:DNA-directed RNA polymerase specialized sigma24 family protein